MSKAKQKFNATAAPPLRKLPLGCDLETKPILRKVIDATHALGELNGFAQTVPNQLILTDTLPLQEAKDSSAVENIITTHDEIFRAGLNPRGIKNVAAKEVQNYRAALYEGWNELCRTGLIRNAGVLRVQEILVENRAGYREMSGTVVKNEATDRVVYTPPQSRDDIRALMDNLIAYINEDGLEPLNPLIKMAIIHHQFESIHPFYDGNGRTGRILNILYLVMKGYLDLPILYLSRFIVQNKDAYYRHLQGVRDRGAWEDYVLFMLDGVIATAKVTLDMIREIKALMQEYKDFLRCDFDFYSQELLNHLFRHPYTRIDFVRRDLGVTRQTASKYLNALARDSRRVKKFRRGRISFFVNAGLFEIFTRERTIC